MGELGDGSAARESVRKLSDAIRDVKNAAADRDDVVVEMREAQRMRLELLAAELQPVFSEVPNDVEMFDLAISSGLQPRLWIDAVSHVGMGRDRRTYRFVRDTRLGRVVLAESTDMKPVADQVTRYVAERLVERQRMMEGIAEPTGFSRQSAGPSPSEGAIPANSAERRWSGILSCVGLLAIGALVGLAVSVLLFWDRLAAMGIGL